MIGDGRRRSMGAQQVGENRSRRGGVGERVVVVGQRDSVTCAQLGQAVGELSLGVETAGEVEGADPPLDDEWNAGTPRGTLDELGIELRIVRREHTAVEPAGELDEDGAQSRRPAQLLAGDAVNVARSDALPPVPQPDQGRPAVDDRAVFIDRDDGDLQDVITPRPESGSLDVDNGVAGLPIGARRRHALEPSWRVSASRCVQSSSAARLATSLRSQVVIVMCPKHDWPRNAWVSTARALFDSPR